MNVTLIHNDDAGDDAQPTPGQLTALIEAAGHHVRDQSLKADGWTDALKAPTDLVVVAGGDGSVGQVARHMVGRATPIAILPLGTANNIAKSLGIAPQSPAQIIARWSGAGCTSFDVGVAAGPWGTRYFMEGVGFGLFTQAMAWINFRESFHPPQSSSDRLAQALRELREHLRAKTASPLSVTLDGRDISGRYLLFEAMITRYVGPNLFLAPDVEHGEGLLHVVGVMEADRQALDEHLAECEDGRTWPADLGVHTGQRLAVEWSGFPVHLDDTSWPREDDLPAGSPAAMVLTVERGALQFLVPAVP